ncbi:MAG: pantetheine-phosphate adenylyltransferase [Alphaproteobacteria bacterium]|nr:pantetheine-phosphate adenylyltransferase [Alphaproteobacteria bacterium]
MTQRIGIYPGTFDPITHGHLGIIQRSLRVVDQLVLGVALDTGKSPFFSPQMRAEMIGDAIKELPENEQQRIVVKTFSGLLVNFAKDNNATILLRGLRAVSDFEYEFQMAAINAKLNPEMETVFLTASESTHFISSRFIKQICRLGGDISEFVPKNVVPKLNEYFAKHP